MQKRDKAVKRTLKIASTPKCRQTTEIKKTVVAVAG